MLPPPTSSWIFLAATYIRYLLPFCCEALKRVWLHLLYNTSSVTGDQSQMLYPGPLATLVAFLCFLQTGKLFSRRRQRVLNSSPDVASPVRGEWIKHFPQLAGHTLANMVHMLLAFNTTRAHIDSCCSTGTLGPVLKTYHLLRLHWCFNPKAGFCICPCW